MHRTLRRMYLFGTASKFNHSCEPNAQWKLDTAGRMEIKTMRFIPEGRLHVQKHASQVQTGVD